MHRKTVHGWMAVLALVATLGVLGARPAAAADLSGVRVADRLANLWSSLTAGPTVLWETVSGWLGVTEKSADQVPLDQPTEGAAWTTDPNGNE